MLMINYYLLNDQDLWQLIKQDDLNAFNKLYERFWPTMFSTAFSSVKDKDLCIEVTNDIFVNLWTKRNELVINSFKAYLITSTRYHIYRKLKSLRASPIELREDFESICQKPNHFNEGESRINCVELQKTAESHLSVLPNRCREIFMLSRNECFSNKEIATYFNISRRTVENQLTIALKHLRLSIAS